MDADLFNAFLLSRDTLRVYEEDRLIFSSTKDRLLPLLEYIGQFAPQQLPVVVFDKVMGNAAALLSVKAGCREVCSPLGSQLAVETLAKHGIEYHLSEIIPCIKKSDGKDMCPMEKLSIGKDPEEFYEAMMGIINKPRSGNPG